MYSLHYARFALLAPAFLLTLSCRSQQTGVRQPETNTTTMNQPAVNKTEAEWKQLLTPQEYHVLREAGTDYPFTGKYTDLDDSGNYTCKACGNLLFHSDEKYHSGCGWPAFFDTADSSAVITRMDDSHGMIRVEVLCGKCHSHLGHVFEDGPRDKTGLRYCINSSSLDFKEKSDSKK